MPTLRSHYIAFQELHNKSPYGLHSFREARSIRPPRHGLHSLLIGKMYSKYAAREIFNKHKTCSHNATFSLRTGPLSSSYYKVHTAFWEACIIQVPYGLHYKKTIMAYTFCQHRSLSTLSAFVIENVEKFEKLLSLSTFHPSVYASSCPTVKKYSPKTKSKGKKEAVKLTIVTRHHPYCATSVQCQNMRIG